MARASQESTTVRSSQIGSTARNGSKKFNQIERDLQKESATTVKQKNGK